MKTTIAVNPRARIKSIEVEHNEPLTIRISEQVELPRHRRSLASERVDRLLREFSRKPERSAHVNARV